LENEAEISEQIAELQKSGRLGGFCALF